MNGTVAISGMALARVFLLREPEIEIEKVSKLRVEEEKLRLQDAISVCGQQLDTIFSSDSISQDTIEILDFQLLMLEDTDYLGKISALLDEGNSCEYSVETASATYINFLQSLEDNDYLRERASDVGDLGMRLLCALQGVSMDICEPESDYIVVARDLSPSQVASMNPQKLKGILLSKGGLSSHCIIIAKSLDIPCIIQIEDLFDLVSDGKEILLDAIKKELIMEPSKASREEYSKYCMVKEEENKELRQFVDKASVTIDGTSMKVFANITTADEAKMAVDKGAEGVGLFRSELIYMSYTSAPSERNQYTEYSKAALALGDSPLIIRTLDVGGDKEIEYLGISKEENPFLGHRAIRYCMENTELFKEQLSAILCAGITGNVSLMLPMITKVEEIREAKEVLNTVKDRLKKEGRGFKEDIQVGIMIETPAAVMDAELLAREVDFFSIGTNDLTQYLFCADRGNPKVQSYNSCYQPVLLRSIAKVARAAKEAGIDVDICGGAGEVEELIPLYVAMGITALSVSIPNVTKVRRKICKIKDQEAVELLKKVLLCSTEDEVREILNQK